MNTYPKYINRATDKFFSYKNWREQLQVVVKTCSYAQAEAMYYDGRISAHVWDCFCRVWTWLNFRMGGEADRKQEAFWNRYGKTKYYAKINRTRAAFGFDPLKDTFGNLIS